MHQLFLHSGLRFVLGSCQDIKCQNYQLAVQALAVDSNLHNLFDPTCHEGKNKMIYLSGLDVIVDWQGATSYGDNGRGNVQPFEDSHISTSSAIDDTSMHVDDKS